MKNLNKIPKTFIGFLIASFLIWLLITFSKEYTTVVTFPVSYSNIPQNKLLQETPIKEIDITVKASGFKLLRTKFNNYSLQLDASKLKRKSKSKFYFLIRNQLTKIQLQLPNEVEIQEVIQDTISLNLGILKSKKVVLKPNININYHIGYDLLDEIFVKPDSIIISGPESKIKNIHYLNLSELKLNDVKNSFESKVDILENDKIDNIKFSTLKATISGSVEKFTEGNLQIAFKTKNLPNKINLTTLTEKVDVFFVVALSNFAKVSEASFKIECDYAISKNNNLGYLIPKIISQPDFIKSVKIIPTKIDFLIQK
ncbi:hypothetical protein [Polaribacter ponticola]|uniref:YbbR-like domain-containing protein n=1 Tax=Polaribacter ponticola TaxID=2978475 RepID=A0ABT5SCX0_9FLAO|nr:hypothetical protein [Polaribacter sp. MSW5]MDD7915971.1 hypothetical protein [Polaribacter sp. MSW5]